MPFSVGSKKKIKKSESLFLKAIALFLNVYILTAYKMSAVQLLLPCPAASFCYGLVCLF